MHLQENFPIAIGKYSFRREATKDMLKKKLNHVVYALSLVEYGIVIDGLWKFK